MNRRGFLSMLGASAAAAGMPLALAGELWTPSKAFFLPPAGGWVRGNSLLTTDMIIRETIRAMHQQMQFYASIDREYDDTFARVNHTMQVGDTVRISLPARLSASA